MRKSILVFFLVIMSSFALAGNVNIDDPAFENGDHVYDGAAVVDADTLSGFYATDFTPISYVQTSEAAWLKDEVGGSGIGTTTLARLLTGMHDLFDRYKTFTAYLDANYVKRSVYEKDISELRVRLDAIEAKELGLDADSFQKHKAISMISDATPVGEYGDYACDMDVCIKSIN